METEKRDKLFSSIKRDDPKAFRSLADAETFGALFGRFPLLSLLYLYRAKRILKAYFSDLIRERPREKEPAFAEADALFLKKAGKSLRYYRDKEVSPLEMLAVLRRGRELKKLYAVYPNASKYLPLIHKIYFTEIGEGVSVVGKKLSLPREPLSFAERRKYSFLSLALLLLGVVIAAATSVLSVYYGLGNNRVFYKARTEGALVTALTKGQNVYLKKDISLSYTAESFGARMQGNDKIVRLSRPFAESFSGEMWDVIFVLEEDFKGEAVILENSGTLRNVRVVAEKCEFEKGGEDMGLLTSVNKGTVENCTAVFSVTLEGDAGGDCYFAPFAGRNEGSIHACRAEGVISAKNVDIAGVAGRNQETGTITDCVAEVTLSETTDIKKWTPNVAGVTCTNRGAIYGSTVVGELTASLLSPELAEGESAASAYAAGIACVNGGSVKNCRVEPASVVLANAQRGYAFAGGVVTINAIFGETDDEYRTGSVEGCFSKGTVRAYSDGNSAYAGGVVAENPRECLVTSSDVSGKVSAQMTSEEVRENESVSSAYAGGIACVNLSTIDACTNQAEISAEARNGAAFSGGIAALNSVTQSYYVSSAGEILSCSGKGVVRAKSNVYNSYAGGVAAQNNQGALIRGCRQTEYVDATTEKESIFDFTGGIVGRNYGEVKNCFFIGTLDDYDSDSAVGAISGLAYLQSWFFQYTINMDNNAYVGENAHTSGAIIAESQYNKLHAGYIYSAAFFESNEGYGDYVDQLLEFGGTSMTLEELKGKEIYYE